MTKTMATWSIPDYDGERGSFSVRTTPILDSGLNFTDINNDLDNLIAAAWPLMRTDTFATKTLSDIDRLDGAPAVLPAAQRESKWEIQYQDIQEWLDAPLNLITNPGFNLKFTSEMPIADFDIRENHSEYIYNGGVTIADPTNAANVQTFVDAFNTVARSPYGGNVVILSMKSVGRNT